MSHIFSYTEKEGVFTTFQPTMENLPFTVIMDHIINLVINNNIKIKAQKQPLFTSQGLASSKMAETK